MRQMLLLCLLTIVGNGGTLWDLFWIGPNGWAVGKGGLILRKESGR